MKLQAAYAGDKAKEITNREAEVVNAWLNLQGLCDARKSKLADTGDLFKFFNMCRILMLWMDDVNRQMNTTEKPRCGDGVGLMRVVYVVTVRLLWLLESTLDYVILRYVTLRAFISTAL